MQFTRSEGRRRARRCALSIATCLLALTSGLDAQLARRSLSPTAGTLTRGACETFSSVELVSAATLGTSGIPQLEVKGEPILGQSVGVQVTGGPAGASGAVFFSTTESPIFLPAFNTYFYPSLPASSVPFTLDADGASPVIGSEIDRDACGDALVVQALIFGAGFGGEPVFTDAARLVFGAENTEFRVTSFSVSQGQELELNGEILIVFSRGLDFSTVSNNTVRIASELGVPAIGTYTLRDQRSLLFTPVCPTEPDLGDAGLIPGFSYQITLPGTSSGAANTVRALNGEPLAMTATSTFRTPAGSDPSELFLDTEVGPPTPVLRPEGSGDLAATYIEFGDDPDNRIYVEIRPDGVLVLEDPAFQAGLNLYSESASRVALVLALNQAVSPAEANLSQDVLRFEFQDPGGAWQPIGTSVELVSNCTGTGATVRLEPIGVLPPASLIRAVILPGFQDIVGQTNLLTIDNFALFRTLDPVFTSLTPPDASSDEVLEEFLVGDGPDSFQDSAPLDSIAATWEDGKLTAGFAFDGDGGPGGNFDWVVGPGENFFFDTTATVIVGGPGGLPVAQQTALGGVVQVRNLTIEAGGLIRVLGPNPVCINATGNVRIDGTLDLSGFSGRDVATLNTGNQVEVGGAGVAGGGRGGNASEVTNNSTPRGGSGQGPFGLLNAGAWGGESGFAPKGLGKDSRRPGGGGGGRFASDERMLADFDGDGSADNPGEEAQAGLNGHPESRGALTQVSPAMGGQPNAGAFVDGDPDNDFFGVQLVPDGNGGVASVVRGELTQPWAGYGGGGGGDAIPFSSFPAPNWNPGSDEKGGPGGGAAGALKINALGRIIIGPNGEILARGGRGATGENTLFLDHVGGTGGSGSGGHVILESADGITFDGVSAPEDRIDARGGPTVIGPAADIPPNISYGGTGSGGVIQLHVPNALDPVGVGPGDDIIVPVLELEGTVEETLDNLMSPVGYVLVPSFGAVSRARSRWISVGEADFDAGGTPDLVRFLFAGSDATGRVQDGDADGVVDELAALFTGLVDSSDVSIAPDGLSLVLSGAALTPFRMGTSAGISNDLYLRTPALLRNFTLRLQAAADPSTALDFTVAAAAYDEGLLGLGDETLTLSVSALDGGETLADFAPGGSVEAAIVPRFFRVETAGAMDALSTGTFIDIRFQAARAGADGLPDDASPLTPFTGDISQFNVLSPGELQFFRFEVEFDLTAGGTQPLSADTEPASLDFLRIPFVF